jgi:FkbM family methyltransferase
MMQPIKTSIRKYLYALLKIQYPAYGLSPLLLKHLPAQKPITLIDVGAHNGAFASAIHKYCGLKQGLLIEPLPHKLEGLKQLFPPSQVQVFNYALSSRSGVIDFIVNEADYTSSLLKIKRELPELSNVNIGKSQALSVQTRRLDQIIDQAGLEKIDLLKVDVQGAEHLVFEGCSHCWHKIGAIWTEMSFKSLYDGSSNFSDIHQILSQAGFLLVELESGFRSPQGEILQGDGLFVNSSQIKK